jgi:hypothetical protein
MKHNVNPAIIPIYLIFCNRFQSNDMISTTGASV